MKYNLLAFIMLFSSVIYAQNFKGTVVNEKQKPLEDVGIFNQNTGQHGHTDATGFFTLPRTSIGDSVYFSNLGYKTDLVVITSSNLNSKFTKVMTESSISLDQVVLVSESDLLSRIVDVDVQTNPVQSSQEILRKVPGLIIGQHAGGGKAEQIFLRGFDIDHGTDVAISVDGMPVNMVSHAHGQGYADLHFVIPETIENVNFGKGPYYADKGNFNTAGFVDLRLRKTLDKSLISFEAGQFNTTRLLGMFNVLDSKNSSAYLASEIYLTDGAFDSPQDFNRINIMGRYNFNLPGSQELNVTASHFQSNWDASGQIPQRAVDQGLIGRFGAIDDTEGGYTSRSNANVQFSTILDNDIAN